MRSLHGDADRLVTNHLVDCSGVVAKLLQYLPGGASLKRLRAAVLNYLGYEYAWDLKFVLRRARVPPARLGEFGHLGWTGWLAPPHEGADVDDVIIDVSDHASTA